jgi:hypothetical protein
LPQNPAGSEQKVRPPPFYHGKPYRRAPSPTLIARFDLIRFRASDRRPPVHAGLFQHRSFSRPRLRP